jgi:hypothetical protein
MAARSEAIAALATWATAGLDVMTGSATPSKESSAKGRSLELLSALMQEKSAELLLNYRLQMRASGCN